MTELVAELVPPCDIKISPVESEIVDNSARKDLLLADRSIVRLGERDPAYREVVFLEEAFEKMIEYGMSDRDIELGGVMLGFHQGDQTIITSFIPLEFAVGTGGSVNITPENWAYANREMDQSNRDSGINDEIISWFHTHPHDYPPSPITADDRHIMKNFFPGSSKDSPNDKTTFIMTTYPNNPAEVLAAWKWDEPENQAVLMGGIAISQKQVRDVGADYFSHVHNEERRVGEATVEVAISKDELSEVHTDEHDQDKVIIRIEQPEDSEMIIKLEDEQGEEIVLKIEDLDPDPEVWKFPLDEITPDHARAMIFQINKSPDSPKANFLRKLLGLAKQVMPQDIVTDIDLVLVQAKSTIDQITILDKK